MTPNWKRLKTDPVFKSRMEKRALIVRAIRRFFTSEGFLEVETPVAVPHPGMEPNLDPFRAEVVRNDGARFPAGLITSPEYAMKKLLAGGLEKIFTITPVFRAGEPWSQNHNPEFSMIEWYRAQADYSAIMTDLERLVVACADNAGGTSVTFHEKSIDLSAPWPRMTMAEAFSQHLSMDLGRAIDDPEWFRAEAVACGVEPAATDSWDDIFFRLFLRDIEPHLGKERPVILYEYPRSMAALARIKPGKPRYAERFEAYVGGFELCNAFSELNDATEQRARLEDERTRRVAAGKHDFGIDAQFVEAVGLMPESAGIALGIDRLVMLLTDAPSIKDVMFFPAQDLFENG